MFTNMIWGGAWERGERELARGDTSGLLIFGDPWYARKRRLFGYISLLAAAIKGSGFSYFLTEMQPLAYGTYNRSRASALSGIRFGRMWLSSRGLAVPRFPQ